MPFVAVDKINVRNHPPPNLLPSREEGFSSPRPTAFAERERHGEGDRRFDNRYSFVEKGLPFMKLTGRDLSKERPEGRGNTFRKNSGISPKCALFVESPYVKPHSHSGGK